MKKEAYKIVLRYDEESYKAPSALVLHSAPNSANLPNEDRLIEGENVKHGALDSLKPGDIITWIDRYGVEATTQIVEILERGDITLKRRINEREDKVPFLPKEWKEGKRDKNVMLLQGITIFSEDLSSYHEFPIRGNYVKTRQGKHLFFANEKYGKNVIHCEYSRSRNRFESDEAIAYAKAKNVIYGFGDKSYIYWVE
jgi:hypothetical protein